MIREKTKDILLSGVSDLLWAATALALSFIIIFLFDSNAKESFLLIPEWSLFSLVMLISTLKKRREHIEAQTNKALKTNTAFNIYSLLISSSVLVFCISLIASKGYLNLNAYQKDAVQIINILLFSTACCLYLFACYKDID